MQFRKHDCWVLQWRRWSLLVRLWKWWCPCFFQLSSKLFSFYLSQPNFMCALSTLSLTFCNGHDVVVKWNFGFFILCVRNVFPSCSQRVPQVLIIWPKMFPIAPHFHSVHFAHVCNANCTSNCLSSLWNVMGV
jgi:hypothetical protein